MEYCAGVWGFQEFESLDRVQIRAMRYLLGVNKYTPTHALFGDMAWVMPKTQKVDKPLATVEQISSDRKQQVS